MSKNRKKPSYISKKAEAKPKKNIKKIIIISSSVIFATLLFAWVITGAFVAYSIINPARKELVFSDGPGEINMVYEFVHIKDVNSGEIYGWWIPAQDSEGEIIESEKTVIISHNYQSNRELNDFDGMFLIQELVYTGYNVVTFDYTGQGNSPGSKYTLGVQEKDELLRVIDYVANEKEQEKIALMGWAFGAASAIVAGSEDSRVSVIIAECPYLDLKSYLKTDLDVWTLLPDFLFSPYIRTLLPIIAGVELDLSPLTAVQNAKDKSFLFLHGTDDTLFPPENSQILAEYAGNAGNNAAYKFFPNVPHIRGFAEMEDEYLNSVLTFLEEYF